MTASLIGRVIMGDSFDHLPGLPDESVDLVLTDPPYGINYRSNRRIKRPKFDHITGDQIGDWIETFARESYRILKPNRHLYCFCRHDTYPFFIVAFEQAGFRLKRTLIWIKNNHGSGDLKGDYAPRDEWIIFAHKGRRLLRGKRPDNILEYDKVYNPSHPTEKPTGLIRFLIEKSSDEGETVLDPFAGVLTTAVAAMDLHRSFIVIDSNQNYIEKGLHRLDDHPHREYFDLE